MSGAYTAKPDVVVVPDLPPGWNPLWPFPGPYPPGYTPEYGITLSAPSYVTPGNPTAQIGLILHDQGVYITKEPSDNSLSWSSSVAETGGPSGIYSENIDSFWSDSGIYTFVSPQVGDTITIMVTSDPFSGEFPIEETVEIPVIANGDVPDITNAIFTLTITERSVGWGVPGGVLYPGSYASGHVYLMGDITGSSGDIGAGNQGVYWVFQYAPFFDNLYLEYTNTIDLDSNFSGSISGTTIIILNIDRFLSDSYNFNLSAQLGLDNLGGDTSVTVECNAKFYRDDDLVSEYTKEFSYNNAGTTEGDTWLNFNIETQEITEF